MKNVVFIGMVIHHICEWYLDKNEIITIMIMMMITIMINNEWSFSITDTLLRSLSVPFLPSLTPAAL